MKILMVCLGNICRSPLAEGILRSKSEALGLDWTVDSAGTGGWHVGETPHNLSQRVALDHGIDISRHHGRTVRRQDMSDFDIIYVMDEDNYRDLKYLTGAEWVEEKVELILNELAAGKNINVPDPWFANSYEAFESVYQMLDKACDRIIARFNK